MLRDLVEDADATDVYCSISGRLLAPDVPVSVSVVRDPASPEATVHVVFADAELQKSELIEKPMVPSVDPANVDVDRDVLWQSIELAGCSALAFQYWSRFYAVVPEDAGFEDIERLELLERGWVRPPAHASSHAIADVEAAFPLDEGAVMHVGKDEMLLAFPATAKMIDFALLTGRADDHERLMWLEKARRRGWLLVLYGCGKAARLPEAVELGDLVGARVRFG